MQDFRGFSRQQWHQRYQRQAAWTEHIRDFIFNTIEIKDGATILEVGSGTGVILDMVSKQGDYNLFGADIDWQSLTLCKYLFPFFSVAQINGERLPFSDQCFDVTFCHFLLLWNSRPANILSEMKRVTRHGGWVLALAEPDYQSRIDYPPPLDVLGAYQTQSLIHQGVDIQIGRKVKAILHQAGLKDITAGVLAAQWNQSDPFDSTEWMTMRADLTEQLSIDQLNRYFEEEQSAYHTGSRVFYVPTFYGFGKVA